MCQKIASILWLVGLCLLTSARNTDAAPLAGPGRPAGVINGVVKDQQGAVVAGAYLAAKNLKTAQIFTTRSGSDGMFAVSGLEFGDYEVEVTAPGFANYRMRITLSEDLSEAPHAAELQATMGVVTITVSLSGGEMITVCIVCSYTYFSLPFKSLPLIDRDPQKLVRLQAGVAEHLGSFSMNGARTTAKTLLLDGFDDRSAGTGRFAANISLDSLLEFNSDYYADNSSLEQSYGQNRLPQLSATSRSGANQLHADAYWYGNRRGLNANGFFSNKGALSSNSVQYDQAGVAIGGPIALPGAFNLRDHAFFFGSFEHTRDDLVEGRQIVGPLPALIERTGSIQGPLFRALVAEGTVPLLSGEPSRIVDLNGDGLPDVGDFVVPASSARRHNLAFGRVDVNASRIQMGARYVIDRSNQTNDFAGNIFSPGSALRGTARASLLGLEVNQVISPVSINSTRLGYRSWRSQSSGSESVEAVAVNTPLGVGQGVPGIPEAERGSAIFAADSYTHTMGPHSLTLGAQILRRNETLRTGGLGSGIVYYSDLLALLTDGAKSAGDPARSIVQTQIVLTESQHYTPADFYGFATDTWRPGSRSVVNIGLGYNLYSGAVYDGARSAKKNFAPSISFARGLTGSEAVILRGGASIVYAEPTVLPYREAVSTPLYPLAAGFGGLSDLVGLPLPTGWTRQNAAQTIEREFSSTMRSAYTEAAFFSVQHSHGRLFVLDAGYNVSLGRHLTTFSRPGLFGGRATVADPNLTAAGGFLVRSDGNSSYHSLQVAVTSRERRGFIFQAHYTLSKSIDTVSTDGPGVLRSLDPGPVYGDNAAANRGLSDFDRRHRVVGFFLWRARERNGLPRQLSLLRNGWEVSGVIMLQSGPHVTLYSSGDFYGGRGDFNRDGVLNDRLAFLGPGTLASALTAGSSPADSYFQASLFGIPGGSRVALGRNVLPAPGYASVDLSLEKNFHITETHELGLRAEAFNLANRVNFDPPVTDLVSADFGRSQSAGNARIIRLSLRYRF